MSIEGAVQPPPNLAGAALLSARVVERCAGCGAERPRGSATACRCAQPRFAPYCTRCVKTVAEAPCPHCLEVARTNGAALGRDIDAALAKSGGRAGAANAVARLETRAATLLREFSVDSVVPPLPAWAGPLIEPSAADSARRAPAERSAISDLRLEQAAVRLATEQLGYLGRPIEEKLARIVDEARAHAAALATFDGLAVGHEQTAAALAAANGLAAALSGAEAPISSIKSRSLDRLAEAASRRARALAACARALRIG